MYACQLYQKTIAITISIRLPPTPHSPPKPGKLTLIATTQSHLIPLKNNISKQHHPNLHNPNNPLPKKQQREPNNQWNPLNVTISISVLLLHASDNAISGTIETVKKPSRPASRLK